MRDGEWIIFEIGRDARTGQFMSVKAARRRRRTTVVEVIRRLATRKRQL
ncbi:MAG TPA: hypothetical protein VF381_13430 [Thermoanaerobaculia bacterium]